MYTKLVYYLIMKGMYISAATSHYKALTYLRHVMGRLALFYIKVQFLIQVLLT